MLRYFDCRTYSPVTDYLYAHLPRIVVLHECVQLLNLPSILISMSTRQSTADKPSNRLHDQFIEQLQSEYLSSQQLQHKQRYDYLCNLFQQYVQQHNTYRQRIGQLKYNKLQRIHQLSDKLCESVQPSLLLLKQQYDSKCNELEAERTNTEQLIDQQINQECMILDSQHNKHIESLRANYELYECNNNELIRSLQSQIHEYQQLYNQSNNQLRTVQSIQESISHQLQHNDQRIEWVQHRINRYRLKQQRAIEYDTECILLTDQLQQQTVQYNQLQLSYRALCDEIDILHNNYIKQIDIMKQKRLDQHINLEQNIQHLIVEL